MGHSASKFLQGSDCFFKHLPYLREWACELLQENKFSNTLPEDAFVFFMHQGEMMQYPLLRLGLDQSRVNVVFLPTPSFT